MVKVKHVPDKAEVQLRPLLSVPAQKQLPVSSGTSWHLLCIPQQTLT